MELQHSPLQGIVIIQPAVYIDDRGFFFESFSEERYNKICGVRFVQDNVSESVKNTVRGLHYQSGEFAQGKLCQVLFGAVLDVAVDVRFGSPTFGQYFSIELSSTNNKQLWIPPGFAHGFSVLTERATFSYKCSAYYSKAHERSIRFNDPALHIDWKVSAPIVSPKDLNAPLFADIQKDFIVSPEE